MQANASFLRSPSQKSLSELQYVSRHVFSLVLGSPLACSIHMTPAATRLGVRPIFLHHAVSDHSTFFSTTAALRNENDESWLSLITPLEGVDSHPTTRPAPFQASYRPRKRFPTNPQAPRPWKPTTYVANPTLQADDAKARQQMQQLLHYTPLKDFHLKNAVLVAMDCEYHQRSSYYAGMSKFGVAVLDTKHVNQRFLDSIRNKDLDLPNHIPALKAAFYRPIEFVNEEKDLYNAFYYGTSTFIKADDFTKLFTRIMADPLRLDEAADFNVEFRDADRNIVLVCHGMYRDLEILERLSIRPEVLANIVAKFDTGSMYYNASPMELKELLRRVKLPLRGLHNAGNDAVMALTGLLRLGALDHYDSADLARKMQKKSLPGASFAKSENRTYQTWKFGGTSSAENLPGSIRDAVVAHQRTKGKGCTQTPGPATDEASLLSDVRGFTARLWNRNRGLEIVPFGEGGPHQTNQSVQTKLSRERASQNENTN